MGNIVDDTEAKVVLGHVQAVYEYLGWDLEKTPEQESWKLCTEGLSEKKIEQIQERISGRVETIRAFLTSGYVDCRYCKNELLQLAQKLGDAELEDAVTVATVTAEIDGDT